MRACVAGVFGFGLLLAGCTSPLSQVAKADALYGIRALNAALAAYQAYDIYTGEAILGLPPLESVIRDIPAFESGEVDASSGDVLVGTVRYTLSLGAPGPVRTYALSVTERDDPAKVVYTTDESGVVRDASGEPVE